MNQEQQTWAKRAWLVGRRFVVWTIVAWFILVFLPSLPIVRKVLSRPLVLSMEGASAKAAYVMAGGFAYDERLRAASDLYHMHRIQDIYLLHDSRSTGYDFVRQKSLSVTERALLFLEFLGVDPRKVHLVDMPSEPLMGSLGEAQALAAQYPQITELVVVTSAPHTRRSWLCFVRSLPSGSSVKVYAASDVEHSAELYLPIFHEYVKLVVYYFLA